MTNHTSAHITAQTALKPAITGWEMYLDDQGRSPHTIKAFMGDLRLLVSFLPPDRFIGSITTTDLNNFLDWMQNDRGIPCSPKTLARRITSIKSFFRWLHSNGVILVDPAEKVVQKSVISPLPTVLTPSEVEAIVEIADRFRHGENPDTRHYTLVTLLLATGIKKGECLNLSPNHVELDAPNGPILFIRYANPQYRYKERKILLPEDWIEAFQEYQTRYTLSDRLFPWSPRRLEYLLEDLSDGAGLEKHLSFDMCRWTCALTDWNAGIEHQKIRQKLGISKVQWREVKMKLRRLSGSSG
jgi:site-specific recombinase XerD